MTLEQIVCVSFGAILQAIVFGLGVAVGVSLATQRGIENVNSNSEKTGVENNCNLINCKPKGCVTATRVRRTKA
jgi:hypothetical protein